VRLRHAFAASAEEVFDARTTPVVLERRRAAAPTWEAAGCEER
jgi:hypothetical protein